MGYLQERAFRTALCAALVSCVAMTTAATGCASLPKTQSRPSAAAPAQPSSGTVQGRVLWNEQPVSGAQVYATSEYNFNSTRYGSATTDERGSFSIAGVPEGRKFLYVFGGQQEFWVTAVTPFTMPAGTGTVATDSYLCKGFDLVSPKEDEAVRESRPVLRWEPYREAVDYAVRVLPAGANRFIFSRGDSDARLTDTSIQLTVDLNPGEYTWRVDAFNSAGHIIGCSYYPRTFKVNSSTAPSIPSPSPSTTLSGTMTDRAGDAAEFGNSSRPVPAPDLVAGVIDVSAGTLTLTLTFAPGTLTPRRTWFVAYLDTDENPLTGFPTPLGENNSYGADYFIEGETAARPNVATIVRVVDANQRVVVGTVSIAFPTSDQTRVVVPLTMLGNDDGRLSFKIDARDSVIDSFDKMPEIGLPPGFVS